MKDLILVIGANGQVGSEITRLLTEQGFRVRKATSKKIADKGSVQLNLATGEGLRDAFDGVDRAFLMAPPRYADHHKILSPLVQEAKRRGLKKTVLMTALGANAAETPFRRAEVELERSGLNYNIIRPNWFMQNFQTFWVHGIKAAGAVQVPAGDAKTSFIDAGDIAAVAAKLLVTDEFKNRDFDLTGPEGLTHARVAELIAEATKRPVKYEDIAPEVLKKGLIGAGLPNDYADFLLLIFSFLKQGYNSATNENVKMILGRAPRSFAHYAAGAKDAWK